MIPSATLDTSLVVEYWKDQDKSKVVQELIDLASSGQLELAVTARIREDVPRPPLSERINDLPELGIQEIGSVTRLGFWKLGRDRLGDDNFTAFSERLMDVFKRGNAKPPDWRDWDHIHAHYIAQRDIFLTWDKRIIEIATELRKEFRILVLTPEEYLDNLHNNNQAGK